MHHKPGGDSRNNHTIEFTNTFLVLVSTRLVYYNGTTLPIYILMDTTSRWNFSGWFLGTQPPLPVYG